MYFFFPTQTTRISWAEGHKYNGFYFIWKVFFWFGVLSLFWHTLGNNDKTQGKRWQGGSKISNIQTNFHSLNTQYILAWWRVLESKHSHCVASFLKPASERASEEFWFFGIIQRPHRFYLTGLDKNFSIIHIFPFSHPDTFWFLNSFLTIAKCLRWQKDSVLKYSKQKWG